MPDAIFEHPRLVAIYDALDSDRRDLDAYAVMVDEFAPTALPTNAADLVLMTGNAAQAVIDPADWDDLLRHTHGALRPGGRFVFETRDPSRRAWERWTRAASLRKVEIDGVGVVETWVELTAVDLPLISFRHTWAFEADGAVLTSDSTLRFRDRGEVEDDLRRHGYVVDEVRDAPDRPGLEFVFVARRTAHQSRHDLTKPGGATPGPDRRAAG